RIKVAESTSMWLQNLGSGEITSRKRKKIEIRPVFVKAGSRHPSPWLAAYSFSRSAKTGDLRATEGSASLLNGTMRVIVPLDATVAGKKSAVRAYSGWLARGNSGNP